MDIQRSGIICTVLFQGTSSGIFVIGCIGWYTRVETNGSLPDSAGEETGVQKSSRGGLKGLNQQVNETEMGLTLNASFSHYYGSLFSTL